MDYVSISFFTPLLLVPSALFVLRGVTEFLGLYTSSAVVRSAPDSSGIVESSFLLSSSGSFDYSSDFFF